MPIVLGIDPGTRKVGYGVVQRDPNGSLRALEYGMFFVPAKGDMNQRLIAIFDQTQAVMKRLGVTDAAAELAFFNKQFAAGGFVTREAIGAIRIATFQMGCPLAEYTPQQVKKGVSGSGNADKLAVIRAVMAHLDLSEFVFTRLVRGKRVQVTRTAEELVAKDQDHISDALAIAVCRLREIESLTSNNKEAR